MITISNMQMETFQKAAEKDFLERLTSFMEIHIETSAKPNSGFAFQNRSHLIDLISVQLTSARNFGLSTEYALAAFVMVNIFYHSKLIEKSFFQRIMSDPNFSADKNMERLMAELESKEAWEV